MEAQVFMAVPETPLTVLGADRTVFAAMLSNEISEISIHLIS